jgi:hypothetical protein
MQNTEIDEPPHQTHGITVSRCCFNAIGEAKSDVDSLSATRCYVLMFHRNSTKLNVSPRDYAQIDSLS